LLDCVQFFRVLQVSHLLQSHVC